MSEIKTATCGCCGKDFRITGMLGGRKGCGCETAICSICNKCHDHCICEWGRIAQTEKIVEIGQARLQEQQIGITASLRSRVEMMLGKSGETLRTAHLSLKDSLLRDALNDSETWYTMYQAWVKRATEAEQREATLQAEVERLFSENERLKEQLNS